MKRPMCVFGASLALFTWVAFFFPAAQAMLLSAATLATGLLVAAFRRPRLRILCAACLTAAVAFALHARYETTRLVPFERMADEIVPAECLITDLFQGTRTVYYTLRATFPENPELPDTVVNLRSYGDMEYLPGDVLRCEIRLAPKEQPAWGLRHASDSYVDGYLEGVPQRIGEGFAPQRRLIALRERLRGNLYDSLHAASADVVSAMVLGLRDNLSSETYSAVNRAGTSHLLAISGLHLSIVAAVALKSFGKLPVSRRAKSLLAMAAVLAFAVLVGFSASIIRSAIMTMAAFLATAFARRRGDALSSLGFSAAAICLIWPDWVLGKSFWLSAGATLGIILFSRDLKMLLYNRLCGRGRLYNKLVGVVMEIIAVSLSASAFTLPLLIVFSGWISLVAPLSNLLVAPFVPVVILGGMLCAAFGSAGPLLRIAALATDFCTAAVLQISEMMAGLPFATASVDQGWMLLWLALAVLMLAVLVVFRADRRLAAYAAALLLVAFGLGYLTQRAADHDKIELAVIEGCDVGVLLRGDDAVILGAPAYYEINSLLRYLEFRQVKSIRAVLATDHGEQVGSALPRLARRYPVDCVVGPNDAYILGQLALSLPDVPVYSGGYAELYLLGGAWVEVLTPGGDLVIRTGNNTILKTTEEYAIIENNRAYGIVIHPDGALVQNGARGRTPTPIGGMLFGEQRWVDSAVE